MFTDLDTSLATDAQKKFIVALLESRTLADGMTVKAAKAKFDSMEDTLTKPEANKIITALKQRPLRPNSKAAKTVAKFANVPAGPVSFDGDDYVVSRPKGWTVGSDGWYFVKTADGKPVTKATAYKVMASAAASL